MRKPKRRIVVDGREFFWVLPGNSLYTSPEKHITVFAAKRGQVLLIDPYVWSFIPRPKLIADAIRFALSQGWTPEQPGRDIVLRFSEDSFYVLPEGVRFAGRARLRLCEEPE